MRRSRSATRCSVFMLGCGRAAKAAISATEADRKGSLTPDFKRCSPPRGVRSRTDGPKSGCFHTSLGLRRGHDSLPHRSGAEIFRHEQRDPGVDAQYKLAVPFHSRVKRVHETELRPGVAVMV